MTHDIRELLTGIRALQAALRASTDMLEMWIGDTAEPTNSKDLTWQDLQTQVDANNALLTGDVASEGDA